MTDPLVVRLLIASGEFALLALLAAVALRWLKPAPRTVALCWCAVLLKPLVSLALGSPLALWEIGSFEPASLPTLAGAPAPAAHHATPPAAAHGTQPLEAASTMGSPPQPLAARPAAPLAPSTASFPVFHRLPLADLIGAGWLFGVTLMLLRSLRDRVRLQRWRAASHAAPPEVVALAQRAAADAGLRRLPAVRVTTQLASPALVGVVRPIILLPEWIVTGRRFMLRWSLRHELAHFRQRDGLLLLLRELAQILFFFHPATWLVSRRLELALELACDRAIVHSPVQARAYARQLVAIREQAGHERALALCGAFVARARLLERVRALLQEPWNRTDRRRRFLPLLPALLVLAAVAGTRLQARPAAASTLGDRLRGRVVDAAARPVANATVRLVRTNPIRFFDPAAPTSIVEANGKTDEAGGFLLEAPAPTLTSELHAIVAEAPDCIPTWKSSRRIAELRDATLVLSNADCPVEGRLTDLEGRPLAGATLKIWSVQIFDGIAFDDYRRLLDTNDDSSDPASHLQGRVEPHVDLPSELTTDAEGRFQLRGVGLDRQIDLMVHAAGFEVTSLQVYTHPGADFSTRPSRNALAMMMADEYASQTIPRHGPRFTHALAPEERIAGVVVDAESGEPIPDCQVFETPLEGSCDDQTDEEGHFELTQLPRRKKGHYVGVRGPKESAYVSRVIHVEPGTSLAPVEIRIALKRGILVHGRITDPARGRPGLAWVDFGAYPGNPNGESEKWAIDGARTDAEGRYSLAVPPGPGVVMVRVGGADAREFCAARPQDFEREPGQIGYVFHGGGQAPNWYMQEVRYLDLPATEKEHALDIALRRGHPLTLRVTDHAGHAVEHCQVFGSEGAWRTYDAVAGSEVSILALEPGVARRVLLFDPVAGSALVLDLTGDETGMRAVKLEPCAWITARLLDDEGKPSAQRRLHYGFHLHDGDYAGSSGPDFHADASGTLRAPMVPGLQHTFYLPKKIVVTLEPGEVKDFGELRFADDAIDGT